MKIGGTGRKKENIAVHNNQNTPIKQTETDTNDVQ